MTKVKEDKETKSEVIMFRLTPTQKQELYELSVNIDRPMAYIVEKAVLKYMRNVK